MTGHMVESLSLPAVGFTQTFPFLPPKQHVNKQWSSKFSGCRKTCAWNNLGCQRHSSVWAPQLLSAALL